jgi:hypothetical protein
VPVSEQIKEDKAHKNQSEKNIISNIQHEE